jgi:hypothetical protein
MSSHKNHSLDNDRTLRIMMLRFMFPGSLFGYWYRFLHNKSLFLHVLLDQFAFQPLCLLSVPCVTKDEDQSVESSVGFDMMVHNCNLATVFGSTIEFLWGTKDSSSLWNAVRKVPTGVYLLSLAEIVRFTLVPTCFQDVFGDLFMLSGAPIPLGVGINSKIQRLVCRYMT